MGERVIRADGVALATQAFGDPAHPAIVLIDAILDHTGRHPA